MNKERIEAYIQSGQLNAACLEFADSHKLPASEVAGFVAMILSAQQESGKDLNELSKRRSVTAAVARLLTGRYAPQDVIDVCRAATSPTPAGVKSSPWLTAGERLPMDGQMVLVVYPSLSEPRIAKFRYNTPFSYQFEIANKEDEKMDNPVTFWMPLPAPPATEPAKPTKSCINCEHSGKHNGAEARCLYKGERSPEVVAMTTQSHWTRATAAEICDKYKAF